MEFLLHIKRSLAEDEVATETVVEARVDLVEEQQATATTSLSMFERRPEGLRGMGALWH